MSSSGSPPGARARRLPDGALSAPAWEGSRRSGVPPLDPTTTVGTHALSHRPTSPKEHSMKGRRLATLTGFALAAIAAAGIPAGAYGSAESAGTHTVTLREIRFHPATLRIHRGDRVKWVWEDSIEHN